MKKIHYVCEHLGIFTNNYKRLQDFYVKKLGFVYKSKNIIPKLIIKKIFGIDCDFHMIKLFSKNGLMIELFEPTKSRLQIIKHVTAGFNHFGYMVPNREKFCNSLKRKGVRIILVKKEGGLTYFIKDPDGNRIEIREYF